MSHEEMGDQLGALARASQGQGDDQHDDQAPANPRPADPAQPAHQTGQPIEGDDHHGEFVAGEVDDESGTEVAQAPINFPPAQSQPNQPYRPLPRKTKKNSELKGVAAPILMTVGAMLLIPAFWAVLVLTGAPVPMADREDASTMAKVMLLCWPLALTLIIPAIFMFIQISAEKKRK